MTSSSRSSGVGAIACLGIIWFWFSELFMVRRVCFVCVLVRMSNDCGNVQYGWTLEADSGKAIVFKMEVVLEVILP
jgi:hypothetical protein